MEVNMRKGVVTYSVNVYGRSAQQTTALTEQSHNKP